MTDINKARDLFSSAGLAFPALPDELAVKLKERDRWVFSTRPIRMWPYELDRYVHQSQRRQIRDYALLSHSGQPPTMTAETDGFSGLKTCHSSAFR
jgi:hypothetical protein